MNWDVTYRGKGGDRVVERVEAAGRDALFRSLEARGIKPIRIEEAKGGRAPAKPSRAARGASRPSRPAIAACAAVAAAAIAGGVWWWMSTAREETPPPVQEPPKRVVPKPKAPQPAPAKPKIAEEKPATNKVVMPPKEKLEPGTRRHVEWTRPDNWDQLTRAEKTRIQPVGRVIKPIGWGERQLFSQPSDRRIERLMRIQPGKLMLGTLRYDERFVKDFLESIKTPIEITEEDTEHDKAIKEAVKAARDDLKAAYDRGEDIAEIMTQTEKQMHELAAYKMNLSKMVIDYRRSGEHSDQDVKDYIEAANVMLKENGMEPLRFGELWFRKAQLDAKESKTGTETQK